MLSFNVRESEGLYSDWRQFLHQWHARLAQEIAGLPMAVGFCLFEVDNR